MIEKFPVHWGSDPLKNKNWLMLGEERSRTESGSARDLETLKPLSSSSALSETSSDSQVGLELPLHWSWHFSSVFNAVWPGHGYIVFEIQNISQLLKLADKSWKYFFSIIIRKYVLNFLFCSQESVFNPQLGIFELQVKYHLMFWYVP